MHHQFYIIDWKSIYKQLNYIVKLICKNKIKNNYIINVIIIQFIIYFSKILGHYYKKFCASWYLKYDKENINFIKNKYMIFLHNRSN